MATRNPEDRPGLDEAMQRRLRVRATAIRDEQVARAIDHLERQRDLGPAERKTVAAMADEIVAALLARPTAAMTGAAAGAERRRAVATAVADLFDLDVDGGAAVTDGDSD